MPKPKNPKEIKQFLGLCGYYRKFVPCFVNISRPLPKLIGHDINHMIGKGMRKHVLVHCNPLPEKLDIYNMQCA